MILAPSPAARYLLQHGIRAQVMTPGREYPIPGGSVTAVAGGRSRDTTMGFCFVNNVAVAARHALDVRGRERLLDGRDAVGPDFQFHLELARATGNSHFEQLMGTLGGTMIPRARLESAEPITTERRDYLRRVNAEHESIYEAVARQDADAARAAMRTHLSNSRERRRRAALAG